MVKIEIEQLLKAMIIFFEDINGLKQNITEEIQKTEDITQDLLRELELSKLDAVETMQITKLLKEIRKTRRSYKDELAKINTLKGFTDKYNNKFIVKDIENTIKNLKTLEKNNKERTYNSKVLENLKCSKNRRINR